MIVSMTGFGRAAGQVEGRLFTLELRAVNNRFLDVVVRLPKQYGAIEEEIKKFVGGRVSRGRVEAWIQADNSAGRLKKLKLDLEMARALYEIIGRLKEELDLAGEVSLAHLLEFRDIIGYEEEETDLEAFRDGLWPVLEEALDNLIEMRQTEGRAIAADLDGRLAVMSDWVGEIEARQETVVEGIQARLETRIKALAEDLELDQGRLLQEAAYLADRSDFTEEVVRLRSHFEQLGVLIQNGGVVGRRLDFLLQEISREVNTIGSKSGDTTVTNLVVDLKAELEKVREQVQNIE